MGRGVVGLVLLVLVAGPLAAQSPPAEPPPLDEAVRQAAASEPALVPGRPTAEPPTPVVALHLRAPGAAAIGREIEYRLVVENRSAGVAHDVRLRVPTHADAPYVRAEPKPIDEKAAELVWKFGTLSPGGRREVLLVLRPTGSVSVTVCGRVQFEFGQCATTRMVRPALVLKPSRPAQTVLNESVAVRLEVTNTSNVDANDVAVTETLPVGLTFETDPAPPSPPAASDAGATANQRRWELGTLRPGERKAVEYKAKAGQGGTLGGRTVVSAAGGAGQEAAWKLLVAEPKLELTQTGPPQGYSSQPATYVLTVHNAGTATLQNVVVRETLPPDAQVLRLTNGGQAHGNQVQWIVPTLGPGAARSLSLLVRVPKPGDCLLRGEAMADRAVAKGADARTTFLAAVGLKLELKETADPVAVGERLQYLVVVRNTGSTATEVALTAEIPPELKLAEVEPQTFQVDRTGDRVLLRFKSLPTLEPNESKSFTIAVKADKPGEARFQVWLSAKELTSGPIHQEESTRVTGLDPAAPRGAVVPVGASAPAAPVRSSIAPAPAPLPLPPPPPPRTDP